MTIRVGFNEATNKYYFVAWNEKMDAGCRLPATLRDWDAAKCQAQYYAEFFGATAIEYHLGNT